MEPADIHLGFHCCTSLRSPPASIFSAFTRGQGVDVFAARRHGPHDAGFELAQGFSTRGQSFGCLGRLASPTSKDGRYGYRLVHEALASVSPLPERI
jgi:hypothetical protein